jgi:hypothetical protein
MLKDRNDPSCSLKVHPKRWICALHFSGSHRLGSLREPFGTDFPPRPVFSGIMKMLWRSRIGRPLLHLQARGKHRSLPDEAT